MKKLLIAVTAIFAFSMLTTSVGIAEPTHPNEVGLYMSPDAYGATGTFVVGAPVTVYLVLSKPADTENGDVPYPTINAFECKLNFNPIGSMFKLAEDYAGFVVNVGDNNNIGLGYLEYIVGFADDIPVIDMSVVLVAITLLHAAPVVTEVTLGPTTPDSIDGQMAFQSVQGQLRIMYSMGGSHEAPVFIFQGEAVGVDNISFGSVKALFR